MKIKVIELFGGIGACSKALQNIGIEPEIVDYVEIDKYAVASFNAIHNTTFEPQDITTWNKNLECDLIMHGSPCQDFSLAGKQAGGDKDSGTRSSLMYETLRIVENIKPKYVIWENVKNLVSKKHIHNFDAYLEQMSELGYHNYWKVLNAKNYGIPQNRERVYTVSICADIDKGFEFPEAQELKLKLKDMLEDNVDEKYYLSDKMIKYISATGTANFNNHDSKINLDIARPVTTDPNKRAGTTNYLSDELPDNYDLNQPIRKYGIFDTEKGKHQADSVYEKEALSPTLDTMQGGWRQPCIEIKNATKQGYLEAYEGDGVDISSRMQYHRGNVQSQSIQTIDCTGGEGHGVVMPGLRIRKLTPKECWRLMGFDDESFEKAQLHNSNTQLYKQAGNSIVVNVLMAIFEKLLKD